MCLTNFYTHPSCVRNLFKKNLQYLKVTLCERACAFLAFVSKEFCAGITSLLLLGYQESMYLLWSNNTTLSIREGERLVDREEQEEAGGATNWQSDNVNFLARHLRCTSSCRKYPKKQPQLSKVSISHGNGCVMNAYAHGLLFFLFCVPLTESLAFVSFRHIITQHHDCWKPN